MDWNKITQLARHAATLDADGLAAELGRADLGEDERAALRRLTRTLRTTGFLATSAPDSDADRVQVAAPGQTIARWKVDTLIGRGGMGEVWRAERVDNLFDQTVALKLMRPGDASRAARFDMERRRLALMEHTGIARILDGGVTGDGIPFMAMEFVDGETIDRWAKGKARAVILAGFEELCGAVHHAHSKFVLHRDIKASNVLVDGAGQVRLIDFGISSAFDEGEAVGPLTIAYAAPEQLIGDPPVSVATDVFALGMLLHELLTGKLPERRPDGSVRLDASALGREMAAVVSRATAFSQNDRYSSADAFAADLAAIRENRPPRAFPGGRGYRFGKFLQRFPLASALAVALVASLAAGLGFSMKFAVDARREAEIAERERAEAVAQFELADLNLLGQQSMLELLVEAYGEEDDPERLNRILIDRWRATHETSEGGPSQTAAISYAAARTFYVRADYKASLEVLDAWLGEGYGLPAQLQRGRELYASALFASGERHEAVPLLREALAEMETERLPRVKDMADIGVQLAQGSGAQEDYTQAYRLLINRAEASELPEEKLEVYSQLSYLRFGQEDFAGARDAVAMALAVFDEEPTLNPAMGRSTLRYNAAFLEIYNLLDYEGARARLQSILDEDVPLHGMNGLAARAVHDLAYLDWLQGDPEAALERMREAIDLQATYLRHPPEGRSSDRVLVAICLADLGQFEDALSELDDLESRTIADVAKHDRRWSRLALARGYVKARQRGTLAIDPDDLATFDPKWIARDSFSIVIYDRMLDMGFEPLVFPETESAD